MSKSIYKHKHHIIPKHVGGTDDPENLIELTVEEHANAHRKLWEQHGRWQDYVAWQALSGQISHYEATIEAIKKTQTGRKHSPETIEKRASKIRGRKHSEATKQKLRKARAKQVFSDETKALIGSYHKGKTLSIRHKESLRQAHKGKPKSLEQRKNMSEAAKRRWASRAGGYSNA